jgi:hypothetical protein
MDVQRRIRQAGASATAEGRRELTRLRREASSLFSELEGGSVQPGTLYPPTPPQRERLERLKSRLNALESGV